MFRLQTPRLNLRPFTLADAGHIVQLLNQPSFIRFIGDRGVRTVADAENYLAEGPLKSYAQNGFGLWCVEETATQTFVGMCGLIKRPELEDVDIGYALLPEFWGRGYATEACAAVLNYARVTLKLNRLVAIVAPDNAASIRVLEKIGLQFERMMPWPKDNSQLNLYAVEFAR